MYLIQWVYFLCTHSKNIKTISRSNRGLNVVYHLSNDKWYLPMHEIFIKIKIFVKITITDYICS